MKNDLEKLEKIRHSPIIREAKKNDLREIREIISYLMKVEKTRDIKRHTRLIIKERVLPIFLKQIKGLVLVAEIDNKIAGIIILEPKRSLTLSIAYIAVYPRFQNLGIGSILIDKAKEYTRKLRKETLQVIVSKRNKKAQEFYKKKGFTLWYYTFGIEFKKSKK